MSWPHAAPGAGGRRPRLVLQHRRPLSTCVLFLLSAAPVISQEPAGGLKGLSLEQLGEIEVVTASKQPVQVNKTPAAIYVITQEDIRRSGATSLPEALRLAPGVEVARIDSVKWSIGIRGFGSRLSRAVLVLLDGRTVYSPLFHGVYWEVQDTLMADIERIEVIRGPGGTIWGANAVNGVINIITKKAGDTQGELVSGGGGGTDQAFGEARYGGKAHDLDYRVYAKGFARGPEYHFDGSNFDDWRREQGGFRADWTPDNRDTVTLQGDIYSSRMGESNRITSLTPPFSFISNQVADLSGGNVIASWDRTLGDGSGFHLETYYDRFNRLQSTQAEYRDTFDFDFVHYFKLYGTQFTWGVGARVSIGRVPEVVPTYTFNPFRRTDQLYSAFVQDEIPISGDRLKLTLGTKILHSAFAGFDFEPSARLLYAPSGRTSFWAAATRAVRTPSDIEEDLTNITLRSSNPLAFNITTCDNQFASEVMYGYEAGYRHLFDKQISLDLAVFRNHYSQLSSLEAGVPYFDDSGPYPYTVYPFTNGNGVKGTTTGFEIIGNWKPAAWWRLQPSYAYLNMDLNTIAGSTDTGTVRSLQGSSPSHEVMVQSYLDLPHNLEFSQIYRYVSRLPAQLVGAYQTVDARVAWHFNRHLEFAVTGQNLLQPHHPEFGGDPGPTVGIRRTVFATVTWRR
jgi:iron complex outermembrane recepter protein